MSQPNLEDEIHFRWGRFVTSPRPSLPFPPPLDRHQASRAPTQDRRHLLAAGRRGQGASGHLRPSRGRGSTPRAALPLFPLIPTVPEARAAGQAVAGEPPPPPLFPSEGKGGRKAVLPLGPRPSLYFFKSPSTFLTILQMKPALLLYFKTDPPTL